MSTTQMPCKDEQIAALHRALEVLDVFGLDEPVLPSAEIVRRTGIAKTTALRILNTLESRGYVVKTEEGSWRLGPAGAWLAARYQGAFDIQGLVHPALHALSRATGMSASFFVRERNARVRLIRIEASDEAPPMHIGESLPLQSGSPGKVILAFTGGEGEIFDLIRQRGFHITEGETYGDTLSISSPVFGAGWTVVGALTLSGLQSRRSLTSLEGLAPLVLDSARKLSTALLRAKRPEPEGTLVGQWFPGASDTR